MNELAALLERFRRGPELVAAVLTGAANTELDFVAEPGKWTLRQVAAHLADAEIVGAMRFRRTLAEKNPTLEAYDQDAWAAHLDYASRRVSDSLEMFRRLRADSHRLLVAQPPEAFARPAVHQQQGPLTLLDLLRIYADHAENHALQMQRLRERFKQARAAGAAR
jgi:hypothetical protein